MNEPTPLHPELVAANAFKKLGMGYVYAPPGEGIEFRVDGLVRERGDWRGRITVRSTLPGLPSHIHRQRVLLEGANTVRDLTRTLSDITGERHPLTPKWAVWIRQLTVSVVDAEEAGAPAMKVGKLPRSIGIRERVRMLLPDGKVTILYGPGGAGKGYIATKLGVCVQTGLDFCGLKTIQGNVMYLDWEDDEEIMNERIQMVCSGMGMEPVEFDYVPMTGRLDERLPEIMRLIDELETQFVIVDSVTAAGGTASEHGGSYEDVAQRVMTAARQLDRTVMLIDHVNDAGRTSKELAGKPYGSVFKGYLSRGMWEVKQDQETNGLVNHVGLYQTKRNHTAPLPPIGLSLDFSEPGKVLIEREDVRDSPTLAAPTSIGYRIEGLLRTGPRLTADQIAEALDEEKKAVRKALERGGKNGKFVSRYQTGSNKIVEWGLAAQPEHQALPEAQDDDSF